MKKKIQDEGAHLDPHPSFMVRSMIFLGAIVALVAWLTLVVLRS